MTDNKKISKTTYPSEIMNFQELMTMPFMEALVLIIEGAVDRYLDRNGLLTAIAEAAKRDKKNESESLDAKGALAFLNANGYPIKQGQALQGDEQRYDTVSEIRIQAAFPQVGTA